MKYVLHTEQGGMVYDDEIRVASREQALRYAIDEIIYHKNDLTHKVGYGRLVADGNAYLEELPDDFDLHEWQGAVDEKGEPVKTNPSWEWVIDPVVVIRADEEQIEEIVRKALAG